MRESTAASACSRSGAAKDSMPAWRNSLGCAPVAPPSAYDSEPEPMLPDIQFPAEGKEAESRRDG